MHRSVPDEYKPVIFKNGVRKELPTTTQEGQSTDCRLLRTCTGPACAPLYSPDGFWCAVCLPPPTPQPPIPFSGVLYRQGKEAGALPPLVLRCLRQRAASGEQAVLHRSNRGLTLVKTWASILEFVMKRATLDVVLVSLTMQSLCSPLMRFGFNMCFAERRAVIACRVTVAPQQVQDPDLESSKCGGQRLSSPRCHVLPVIYPYFAGCPRVEARRPPQ